MNLRVQKVYLIYSRWISITHNLGLSVANSAGTEAEVFSTPFPFFFWNMMKSWNSQHYQSNFGFHAMIYDRQSYGKTRTLSQSRKTFTAEWQDSFLHKNFSDKLMHTQLSWLSAFVIFALFHACTLLHKNTLSPAVTGKTDVLSVSRPVRD